MNPDTKIFSLIGKNVRSALPANKQNYVLKKGIKEINKSNYHRHTFEKSDILSSRAPGRSFRKDPEGIVIIAGDSSMPLTAPEDHSVGQDMEAEDSNIYYSDSTET